MKRAGVVLILLLAFAGLANSTYLAQHEKDGTPLICNVQNLSGCNIVAASQYSRLFGISLGEYGVLFYGILFVLAALELVLVDRLLRRILQGVSLVGVIASLYFTALQLFIIGAFCIYCTASAIITLLIFIFASFIEPLRKNNKKNPPASATSPASGLPKGSIRMPPTP
ncbi:hypothetical protein A3A36_01380 [Candidatus Kaiserbacteria bacterium RIFCSPLOWO2_01_FULL_52_12b]|uniref:Vitamin K epoxide reductase domain-containing protein n=1 Tax=Candidatus Kaiserbacteria bacterium RIFCSPLOWO2_01_FULL_52_12b TaxID=1798509 RepID=A0A1F6EXU9_9BACT|nr:MAG: hypothetical protein A3A36_01380 [Candidatus Kaiserbacteria bacterium RIFCSPLOWO2_01_FULL_52_12b]